MKKISKNFLEFYHKIHPVSIHILASGMEISGLLFLASMILFWLSPNFTYMIKVQQIAASCSSAGVAFIYACLFLSFVVDIVARNRSMQEKDDK